MSDEVIELWNRNELSNESLLTAFEAEMCRKLAITGGELQHRDWKVFDGWLSYIRRRGDVFQDSSDFLIRAETYFRGLAIRRHRWESAHPERRTQRPRPESRRSDLKNKAYSNLMAFEQLETLEQLDSASIDESIRGLERLSSPAFDSGHIVDIDPPSRLLVAALSNMSAADPEAARFAVLRLFAGQTLDEIAVRTGHSINETYKIWLDVQSRLHQSGVKTEAGIWLPVPSDDILRVISHDPNLLQQVSWREFERIIADLLARLGFEIELQQGTKDGGIDILALRGGAFGDDRYLIQAKRWKNKVGVEPVRQLLFLQGHYRATKGCLATTSSFTQGARELAAEYRWQLDLKDLRGIQTWVAEAIRVK